MKPQKKLDALKWLNLACAKDYRKRKDGRITTHPQRPILTAPHADTSRTVAADGHRIHLVHERVDNLPAPVGDTQDMPYPNVDRILPDPAAAKTVIHVTTRHLQRAAKCALAFAKERPSNPIELTINGSLQIAASAAELGDCSIEIGDGDTHTDYQEKKGRLIVKTDTAKYQKTGEDTRIGVNAKYLLDTLSGMPDEIEIRLEGSNAPLHFRGEFPDGEIREAVVMPISLERSK